MEAEHGCVIDTARPVLDLADVAIRQHLRDLPVRDTGAFACLGWRGQPVSLHAGHDAASAIIGQIVAGDYVNFGHLPEGEWSYVTTTGPNWGVPHSGGWYRRLPPEGLCTDWAG